MDHQTAIETGNAGGKYPVLRIVLVLLLILIAAVAAFYVLRGHPERVKGVSKITARFQLSLAELTAGTIHTAPEYKLYVTFGGHEYRLMPTGEISVGANEYTIEGLVPRLDPKLVQGNSGNSVPPEVLTEAGKLFDQVCRVKPEFAKRATKAGFATVLWRYINEEGRQPQRVLVVLSTREGK